MNEARPDSHLLERSASFLHARIVFAVAAATSISTFRAATPLLAAALDEACNDTRK